MLIGLDNSPYQNQSIKAKWHTFSITVDFSSWVGELKFGQLIDASFRTFFQLNWICYWGTGWRMDRTAFGDASIQSYIFVKFLGHPDDMSQEEKPSFLKTKNDWLWTDERTDQPSDGRTDPLVEMRGRI